MTFVGELLPYQPPAVERMVERGKVLVAYDLGLGKTVLTIAAVEQLMDTDRITEPGLVICLSSLKYQWAAQIHRWTGGEQDDNGDWIGQTSSALVIDGTPAQRAEQYARARAWEADYIVLNYEQVVNDWDEVRTLPRGFVVCDEATAIKSFRAKRSRRVKRLSSPYKFALTGTPIENGKPEELFSIMQWVDDEVLGRFDIFDKAFIVRNPFGGVSRYRNLPTLHKRLSTACVRKSADDPDVAPYMPDQVVAEPILVPFDRAGAKLYRQISQDLLADLAEAAMSFGSGFDLWKHYGGGQGGDPAMDALRGQIMSKLGALRQLCDHPELLRISAANGTSKYAVDLADAGLLTPLRATPKLDATVAYLQQFLEDDPRHKAVVFSFFKPTLGLLEQRVGVPCALYSGDMNAKQKEASKLRFQTDPDCRLLLSSDAGGYGVDLPQASLSVNYDQPWAAGAKNQRNGRTRRASSTWSSVLVQDVLMRGSIEERQYAALAKKSAVAAAVVDGKGIDARGGIAMDLSSLTEWLRTSRV